MAKIWTNGYDCFETEDDARDNAYSEMTWDDIENYFNDHMDFHEFFTRVREKMPNFFETFEIESYEAENEYFNNNYWEEEQEDNED